jgi:hypothetical protein
MYGIFLVFLSSIAHEIGLSIGKDEVSHQHESIIEMGFLNLLWATVFFVIYALIFAHDPHFSLESLPFLMLRIILEIIMMHVVLRAITKSDRSTYGFLRIWTIPLLLIVDIYLGYSISTTQMFGIGAIILSFIFLYINHGIKKEGSLWVLASALLAVLTVSLYKYNISNFNSVEVEQSIVAGSLLIYCLVQLRRTKSSLKKLLLSHKHLLQSISMGIAGALVSFAFLFAPATIIITARRSFSILASIISGNMYFYEKKPQTKLAAFFFIVVGLFLLI